MSKDRRHASIMFTDIVGYTSLMGSDEDRAFEVLSKNRDIHQQLVVKYHGTLIKEMGDGMLISFNLASDAVYCAIEIQKKCREQDIPLKIGIHEGEMVFEGADVLGDAVNVASRLESDTKEGCIYISGSVYRDIKNRTDIKTKFVKDKKFKNVDEPIKVHQVLCEEETKKEIQKALPEKTQSKKTYYIIAGLVVVIAAILIWQFLPTQEKEPTPVVEDAETVEINRTIAVLPFVNMSPDQDQEYFSDGMMDEILMHLFKIGDLVVTSRTSVMKYKGTIKTIPEIAEELGVANILEGSVRKSGDKIRITAQLIDAANDQHLWAENYDRNYADIFDIQSEVAQRIASSLKAAISPDLKERIEDIPTKNMEAYEYYLKGNESYWASWDSLDTDKAYESIEYFQQSIELDNNFSFAYTGLGRSYWWLAYYEAEINSPSLWENSIEALDKAIQLDPRNGWAYAEIAVVYSNYEWDSTATRISLDKAMELMPNDRNSFVHYFWHEFRLGNCEKLRWIVEAEKRFYPVRLNQPYNQRNFMILTCQKRYTEIVSIAEEYWENQMYPTNAEVIFNACLATDAYELANQIINIQTKTMKHGWAKYSYEAELCARKNERQKVMQLIDTLSNLSPDNYISNTWYASIYASLGEKDKMYEYLNIALQKREQKLHDINFISAFDPYVDEPQFKEVVRKMWIPLERNN